jgi:hypothetical protein
MSEEIIVLYATLIATIFLMALTCFAFICHYTSSGRYDPPAPSPATLHPDNSIH